MRGFLRIRDALFFRGLSEYRQRRRPRILYRTEPVVFRIVPFGIFRRGRFVKGVRLCAMNVDRRVVIGFVLPSGNENNAQ